MITEIQSQRLLVISDLHLGNPFSRAKKNTVNFLNWAKNNHYDVAINGDGFEIAQVSFVKIARDVPEVFHALKSFTASGQQLYYIIGNHDIVLENFLNDWGGFKMAPFLNLRSGDKRIRIEHGHLYDPSFVNYPRLYEVLTWIGGFALKINPSFYRLWISFEKLKSQFLWKNKAINLKASVLSSITGEHPAFGEAALELSQRGFDAIIFGHTHHAGYSPLPSGAQYFNSGSWLIGAPYIKIQDGQLTLEQWQKDGALPVS